MIKRGGVFGFITERHKVVDLRMGDALSDSGNSESIIPSSDFEPPPPIECVLSKTQTTRISIDPSREEETKVCFKF